MIKTVLENMDGKRNLADVSAKLLTVKQRASRGRSSSSTGVKSQAFAASDTKKPWDKKAVVCYYCDKKRHMKRDCLKRKADDARGNKKPNGGRRDGGGGGGAPPRAALAYAASAGQSGEHKTRESSIWMSTWVLVFGATSLMAAVDKGFTVETSGIGAKVTVAEGHKLPIKGHGYISMDVGAGNTKVRMVFGEAMLVPDLTDSLLSVRAVDRRGGAVVFVGDTCYILSDGEAVLSKRGVEQRVCHRFGQRVRELCTQGDAGQGVGKRRLNTHGRRGGAVAPQVQPLGFREPQANGQNGRRDSSFGGGRQAHSWHGVRPVC